MRFITMRNLLFFSILLLIAACKKDCHNNVNLCIEPDLGMGDCITDSNQVKQFIFGKWNWTQTETWGMKRNPCTDTLNYTYDFIGNGQVRVFVNGTLASVAKYEFSQNWVSWISISDTTATAHSEIFNAGGGVRLCGIYLIIDNSPVDGPKLIFRKED